MEQTLINALFRVIDMDETRAREKAPLLAGIIMSNRLSTLDNREDMMYVEELINMLKTRITEDLNSETIDSKDTHEELIHAYVSLSKALEYAHMTVK